MSRQCDKHPIRGAVAGVAGGLFASWIMNEFIAGPGKKLTKSVQTREENQKQQQHKDDSDATMKTADVLVETATGGRHLTREQQETAGPIVHYAFGALMGGVYGALAEYSGAVRFGFGTAFGSALFAGADLLAVPALHLAVPLSETPAETLVTPFAAHLVYGTSTDLVRRLIRKLL